jgi:hypothetical protein
MKSNGERGFFRSLLSGSRHHGSSSTTASASNQDDDDRRRGSGGTTDSSGSSFGGMRTTVKHHSFNGALSFNKLAQGSSPAGVNGQGPHDHDRQSSILSKRPSLIIPFNANGAVPTNGSGGGAAINAVLPAGEVANYLADFQAPISKSGVLIKQANHLKTWKKRLMVLKGHSLFYYVSGTVRSSPCLSLA